MHLSCSRQRQGKVVWGRAAAVAVGINFEMWTRLMRSLFGASRQERSGNATGDVGTSLSPRRDVRFEEQLQHFLRIPEMLADIELYFAITMLGMAENLLSLLLTPLKFAIAFRRFERRDAVALVLIGIGVLTFYVLSLYTTQLYAYLYHVVRRTSFIKLMMVFNILDVADKLLSALSQEAIEVLTMCVQGWGKKVGSGKCKNERVSLWFPVGSVVLSIICVAAHSVTLLLSVITLNVAVNAEGNLLLALMVSSNFSELKGIAYKKQNRESLQQVAAADAIERMKFFLFVLIMAMQHMHKHYHVLDIVDTMLVLLVEVFIDFTKHLFVAKFNGISLGVYRSYSQLTLLDMAIETLLWRLSGIEVCCIDDPRRPTRDIKPLLTPSAGFFPKYVRRTGFIPVPYAALLLWSFVPLARLLFFRSPLLLLLIILAIVLLKLVMAELIRGVASRFVVRSLVVVKQRGNSARTTASAPFGVSPLNTPSRSPHTRGTRDVQGSDSVATLRLTSFLCSLLSLEPFDLQAGKAKR